MEKIKLHKKGGKLLPHTDAEFVDGLEDIGNPDGIDKLNIEEQLKLAATIYKWGMYKEDMQKYFALCQITDTHASEVNVQRAFDFSESKMAECIDMFVHTGDIEYLNSGSDSRGGGDKYIECLRASKKPWFTALGNHDTCGSAHSNAFFYNRFMKPSVDKGYLTLGTDINEGATWWKKTYDQYKVVVIGVCDYDSLHESGFVETYNESTRYSQEQLDFVVNTLKNVPAGYTVLVLKHGYSSFSVIDTEWSKDKGSINVDNRDLTNGRPLMDILNAYQTKTSLQKTYTWKNSTVASNIPAITINADFTSAKGDFGICIIGHRHMDEIVSDAVYPNIKSVLCGCGGFHGIGEDYIARGLYGKALDLMNVYVVRPDQRKVYIVRIGANLTTDGKVRSWTSVSY